MSRHPLDQRTVRYEAAPEAIARLEALRDSTLERDIELALTLAEIDRGRSFLARSATSAEELAARLGHDGFRAHDLKPAGHALYAEPCFVDLVKRGEVVFAALISLGRLYGDSALYIDEDDEWVLLARTLRLRDLKRRVNRRIERIKQAKTVRPWSAHVSEETRKALDDCREIASIIARQALTRGQVLAILAAFYRMKNDIL